MTTSLQIRADTRITNNAQFTPYLLDAELAMLIRKMVGRGDDVDLERFSI